MKEENSGVRMRAHPTKYAGVLFRSRLEARWAAFFDLAGWKWLYEPFDDEGWVPDFVLPKSGLAIEVKPIEWRSGTSEDILKQAIGREDCQKVIKSSRMDKMIIGAYPLEVRAHTFMGAFLGNYLDFPNLAPVYVNKRSNNRFDMTPRVDSELIWFGSGELVSRYAHERGALVSYAAIDLVWREAGNRTQWRGGAPRRSESLFDD